jgi:hypothetical protein
LKLGTKRPGTSTSFCDSILEEALLEFSWKEDGSIDMAFHIYDAFGTLVADSGGAAPLSAVVIKAEDGEVLLEVRLGAEDHIRYRLYSRAGMLLTASDGEHTQIFSYLKMGGSTGVRRTGSSASTVQVSQRVEE